MTIREDFQRGLIPNTITFCGLLLIPLIIAANYHHFFVMSLAAYVAAWFLDWLDGYVARRIDLSSQTGAFFDPLVDKIFTSSFLIYFWDELNIFVIMLVFSIGLSLTVLRIYKIYYGKKKEVPYNIMSKLAGKIKTNFEKSAFCLLILAQIFAGSDSFLELIPYDAIANFALAVAIPLALLSLHHQIKEIS